MKKILVIMLMLTAIVVMSLGLVTAFEDPWMNTPTSDGSIVHRIDGSQQQTFDLNSLPGGSNFTSIDAFLDGNITPFIKPKMVEINNSNHWQLWF